MSCTLKVLTTVGCHAGFTWDGMIHKITSKQWDAMLAVHCTAPFRLIQASVLPANVHLAGMLCAVLRALGKYESPHFGS